MPTRMRGSAMTLATEATGAIAFCERAGGGDAGVTTGGREGGACGAEAQAANTKSETATAMRFIDQRPCKKRDSNGVRCPLALFSEVHFRTMTPKLRTIRTTRRVGSVSRKDIRAALKVVMSNRTPEIERLALGLPVRKKTPGASTR